jgi:hypothetical protein
MLLEMFRTPLCPSVKFVNAMNVKFILRIKEQRTHLALHKRDDDDKPFVF